MNDTPSRNSDPARITFAERWGRGIAIATAILFLVSLIFPITAALSKALIPFPELWGMLDVGIAFILAIMAFVVIGLAQGKVNKQVESVTYRAYRILIHTILALLIVFFLFGDKIDWNSGITGIAWRGWLLLYCLPSWIALSRITAPPGAAEAN